MLRDGKSLQELITISFESTQERGRRGRSSFPSSFQRKKVLKEDFLPHTPSPPPQIPLPPPDLNYASLALRGGSFLGGYACGLLHHSHEFYIGRGGEKLSTKSLSPSSCASIGEFSTFPFTCRISSSLSFLAAALFPLQKKPSSSKERRCAAVVMD